MTKKEFSDELRNQTNEMYGGLPPFNIVIQTPEDAYLLHDMALFTAFSGRMDSYTLAVMGLNLFCVEQGSNEKGVAAFVKECGDKVSLPKWFGPLTVMLFNQRDKNSAAKKQEPTKE